MPNKYEREIEEILRNMDRTEPKLGLGNRIRAFNRPRPRRPRRAWEMGLSASEAFLLGGICLILFAAGLTYFLGSQQPTIVGTGPLGGWLALLGFVLFVVGLVIGWRRGFNFGRASTPGWRGNEFTNNDPNNTAHDSKIVHLHARRNRNPFKGLVTQVRILRLKLRYRRIRDHEDKKSDSLPES